ncbi:MAG TPA: hypothetical protein VEP67_13095 [Thiobacillaceae bacterium]|nr:hypothetical protein [Thiobacillaceae bacterium]
MTFAFEQRHEPLAPLPVFLRRLVQSIGLAVVLIGASLAIGMAGYHWIAGFVWIDALLNASMILGGMGPVNALNSDAAKVFASLYALYSGLVLIALMGILLTPIVHRMLHYFHLDSNRDTPRSSHTRRGRN